MAAAKRRSSIRRCRESEGKARAALGREPAGLAAEMLVRWPKREWPADADEGPSEVVRMLGLLTRLDAAVLIGRFLAEVVAAGGFGRGDADAVVAALGRLPPRQAAKLVECIVQRTAASLFEACAGVLAGAAEAGMVGLKEAGKRLIAALPGDPARMSGRDTRERDTWERDAWGRVPAVGSGFVVDLMTGLAAVDAGLAERAGEYLLAWPKTYGMDPVLVPAVRALARAGTGRGTPGIARLRAACRAHLAARIAEPLAPPADWSRASALACRCAHCAELSRFLADPERATWILRPVEHVRGHVEETIRKARCDVDTKTDKHGRPYGLVCTKNRASYERRARQRKQDLADLALLDA
jgi:hypothetical protein